MSKNYLGDGNVLKYTAVALVLSGTVVLIGKRIGVAVADIAAGATGSLTVVGTFSIAKLGTDNVGQGDLLYWDAANSRLTTTSAGNTLAGYATAAAGAGVATVSIKING